MGLLKKLMSPFNKVVLSKALNINETRTYNFVGGEYDKYTLEQVEDLQKLVNESATKAVIELENIKNEKRMELEN